MDIDVDYTSFDLGYTHLSINNNIIKSILKCTSNSYALTSWDYHNISINRMCNAQIEALRCQLIDIRLR